MEKFADCVKRLRKDKGLKIYQVADMVGTTPEFFSQVEGSKKYPSISTLDKLSALLGEELKTLYFKQHRPDILALLGKSMTLPRTKASRRSRKGK